MENKFLKCCRFPKCLCVHVIFREIHKCFKILLHLVADIETKLSAGKLVNQLAKQLVHVGLTLHPSTQFIDLLVIYLKKNLTAISDKSVKTLGSKIRFSSFLETCHLLPQNNVDFAISRTSQTTGPHTTLNWGQGVSEN